MTSNSTGAVLLAAVFLALGPGLTGPGPVRAQQQVAPDTLRETFQDWTVQCETPGDAPRVCEMLQQVDHPESSGSVLLFSMRYDAEDRLVGVLVAPFGLRLSEGVQIRSGDTVLGRYGFETCLSTGCVIIAPFDGDAVATMRAALDGQVRAVTRGGEDFAIPVSFRGFSAALDRLQALSRA